MNINNYKIKLTVEDS